MLESSFVSMTYHFPFSLLNTPCCKLKQQTPCC